MFSTLMTMYKNAEYDPKIVKDNTLLANAGEFYMILFGENPNILRLSPERCFLLIMFTFLINIMTLNLLIAIIGDTFDRILSTSRAIDYQMKTKMLLELATIQYYDRND